MFFDAAYYKYLLFFLLSINNSLLYQYSFYCENLRENKVIVGENGEIRGNGKPGKNGGNRKKSEENPETVGKSDNELLREIEVYKIFI